MTDSELAVTQEDYPGWEITTMRLGGGTWYRATRDGMAPVLVADLPTLRTMLAARDSRRPADDAPG